MARASFIASFAAHRVIALAVATAALGGCQLERMFPEDVGNGAARLSVRNSVKLLSFVDADTTCGFSSEQVLKSYTQQGEVGSEGSVTWTVRDCEIDFGKELRTVSTDCLGEDTAVKGKIKVSSTRTVTGLLTGNPEQPVIPSSPDAVTLTVAADVHDYQVRLSTKTSALTVNEGHIEVVAGVHLAQSASLGVCSVATSDVTLNSVVVTDAVYSLDDNGHVFDVDVPRVDIEAQIGNYGEFENYISGKITVWDTDVTVADDTLDPEYEPNSFRESFSCSEDLLLPVTYECKPLTPMLAEGAAKLTVQNAGNVVSAIVADRRCGFASPAAVANAVVTGEVGHDGGSVTYSIEDCVMTFSDKQQVARDCGGKATLATGTASVSGTMTVRGRVTGNPLQPIIPTSRDPATIDFSIDFENFSTETDGAGKFLEVKRGTLSGRLEPQMAIDTTTGACSIATPVVTLSGLSYSSGTEVVVHAGGNALGLTIDGATLDAQNGSNHGRENYLFGQIIANGETYPIPLEGSPVLDPEYDASAFASSFACTPNMRLPTSEEQCNFHQVIGDGAARLIIQSVGSIASMVNADSDCGFEDTLGVLLWPTDVQGDNGEMGSMTWDVEDCVQGGDSLFVQASDCLGGNTFVEGYANVSSTRTVYGERDKMILDFVIDSIIPRSSHSVELWLNDVELSDFVSYALAPGQSEPLGKLTIHSGTLSALVEPATAENASDPGTFDVPTPVARISGVVLQNATATLEAQGMIFEISIPDTYLGATNGGFLGETNSIEGSIVVDGDTVDIGGALNPDYNPSSFDQSYSCTENLLAPVR